MKKRPMRIYLTLTAAAVAVVLLISGCGDSGTTSTATTSGSSSATVVPESGLLRAMKGAGYPVYWAGPRLGVEYEVSRQEDRAFVRYLPKGEEPESERKFLTVGSYKDSKALAGIRESGQKAGAILVQIDGGGTAYAEGVDATSAYMAFPGVNTQVEVFDPKPGEALRLIRSGAIVPVGS
ncbi:MAG TPA: hypothetical protein VFJ65_10115 [Solirubrobacterales bacterium]|nr:hypothetical protein [Solirubrobacterales bacterium]